MDELLTTNDQYEPAEDKASTNYLTSCGSCSFDNDAEACETHACVSADFPDDHPMSRATHPIIWRKKQ
ncbi:hypothetical protein RSP795_10315 [Ralstonia solanacearum]|uniref:hypothetical protein n=1 Tax=Ralstonia solanacearum TaxID=305 RepID=UPI0007D7ADF8|nr:hypothetical protein [Ralstonia solanacearum]OAI62821.1 hypothetical protein RSP795_10315 [Ralstonia solanacearum]